MRDPEAYKREGRNDPTTPQQREEHPYDFVYLPEKPKRGGAVGHDRYPAGRLSGRLRLVYKTKGPLHVGSGVFETAQECGLEGGSDPVRGIMRQAGKPILPGSSWKGAVRARFEAITASRIALADTSSMEHVRRLPQALLPGGTAGGKRRVGITDPRLSKFKQIQFNNRDSPAQVESKLKRLSPAEALFGCLGYRGRISPREGLIQGPEAKAPLQVTPLDGPALHRVAKPGQTFVVGRGTIRIAQVEGRKFYYTGGIVTKRVTQSGNHKHETFEWIDYVPPGNTIEIDIHLHCVTEAELGALLLAAGHGDKSKIGIVRFGGYKPAGLGEVELQKAEPSLRPGKDLGSWTPPSPQEIGLDQAVEAAMKELIDPVALPELAAVTLTSR